MGIFQQFPYTNFHEMNLDEMLRILKEMSAEWEETKTEWVSYKDFIDHFFENHNITENVLEALRIMFADGEIAPYINKYYDTLSGMISDTSLLPGVIARTLGGSSLNDGRGETYYISDSEIFGKDHVDLANGLWASPLSQPFNCEPFTNDDSSKQWMSECALNWIQHAAEIHYGGDKNLFFDNTAKVNGYWLMTCSIFVMAMVFGIDFDNSKYNYLDHNIQNPNAYFDDELMEKLRDPQGFYSDDILAYFMAKGYAFIPESNLSNMQTGDIIFYAQGVDPDNFLSVDHSAIFAYHNTDETYTTWEVGGDAGPVQLTKRYDGALSVPVMAVRLPFKQAAGSSLTNMMIKSASSTANVAQIHNYLSERFKVGKWYTFIAKITNIGNDRAKPALYANGFNDNIVSYNSQYIERPYNDIYVLPFVAPDNYGDVYPSIVGAEPGVPDQYGTFEWVEILEGFHPDTRDFIEYYEPIDDFGDAITTTHTKGSSFSAIRCGRVCNLNIALTITSAVSAYGVVATLPAGYYPIKQQINSPIDITESGNIRTLSALSPGATIEKAIVYLSRNY